MRIIIFKSFILLFSILAFQLSTASELKPVLSDPELLSLLGIPTVAQRSDLNVGLAFVSEEQEKLISDKAHEMGRCGGYELLNENLFHSEEGVSLFSRSKFQGLFQNLEKRHKKDQKYLQNRSLLSSSMNLRKDPVIEEAVNQVSSANIRSWVEWLSSFPTRHHASPRANDHAEQMKERLENLLRDRSIPYQVELVSHNRTNQKSLKVTLVGATRPDEIVVMGGHYDSINSSYFGGREAPGADDNASGSACLVEALRIISKGPQPHRTIEFMWYAAEEVGLVGSGEIAQGYRQQDKDVVAVLQLDMTLHPGSGAKRIASITDFTSPWLRDLLVQLNDHYIGVEIINDRCGYACSDHASWYRQGYSTLMPFESTMNNYNRHIHTARDVINMDSNFEHAAKFAQIAVAFGKKLGYSTRREP